MKTRRPYVAEVDFDAREYAALSSLCIDKDMSEAALLRQALRFYQSVDLKLRQGKTVLWQNPDGTIEKEEIHGCGPGN